MNHTTCAVSSVLLPITIVFIFITFTLYPFLSIVHFLSFIIISILLFLYITGFTSVIHVHDILDRPHSSRYWKLRYFCNQILDISDYCQNPENPESHEIKATLEQLRQDKDRDVGHFACCPVTTEYFLDPNDPTL